MQTPGVIIVCQCYLADCVCMTVTSVSLCLQILEIITGCHMCQPGVICRRLDSRDIELTPTDLFHKMKIFYNKKIFVYQINFCPLSRDRPALRLFDKQYNC